MAFFMQRKSKAGNDIMDIIQNIPISRDLAKAQDAMRHKINGRDHT
jgi:hypothetical protein